jgi:hypothetical protein
MIAALDLMVTRYPGLGLVWGLRTCREGRGGVLAHTGERDAQDAVRQIREALSELLKDPA